MSEYQNEGRLLRLVQITEIMAVSRSTVYRMIANGDFPEPMRIGKSSVWSEEDVNHWLRAFKSGEGDLVVPKVSFHRDTEDFI